MMVKKVYSWQATVPCESYMYSGGVIYARPATAKGGLWPSLLCTDSQMLRSLPDDVALENDQLTTYNLLLHYILL